MNRILWVALLVLAVGVFALAVQDETPAPRTDLTKEEALMLMDLQTKALLAVADRDEYVKALYAKYGLVPGAWDLDIRNGKFIPAKGQVRAEQKK